MNVSDFHQWAKERKMCIRGMLRIRCMTSGEAWKTCRRADWLCWILDWTVVPYPNNIPYWDRRHWQVFLRAFNGYGPHERMKESYQELFKYFVQWDNYTHLFHDATPESGYGFYFANAEAAIRKEFPRDPLEYVEYKPIELAPDYMERLRRGHESDYPIEFMKEVLDEKNVT